MSSFFQIPVVLFLFRRLDTVLKIIDVLREVKPRKIYLLSDAGRTAEEKAEVNRIRSIVYSKIDWHCEIIKKYAETNIGVYENIGLGAKWVFEHEERAIFLEDDNLPSKYFFKYCQDTLDIYQSDPKVLWVCGTNYLGSYKNDSKDAWFFTQHMLPCGWASWAEKFNKNYDSNLKLLRDPVAMKRFKKSYKNKALYRQQRILIEKEAMRKQHNLSYISWDYHMLLTLRGLGMYGVSPTANQINNIGADLVSTHGGTSMDRIMTARFCNVPVSNMPSEIILPKLHDVDTGYDRKISEIILWPARERVPFYISHLIRKMLRLHPEESIKIASRKMIRGLLK